jgi:hypothetical protein
MAAPADAVYDDPDGSLPKALPHSE